MMYYKADTLLLISIKTGKVQSFQPILYWGKMDISFLLFLCN